MYYYALISLGNRISFLETAASLDENPEIVQAEAYIKQPMIGAIEMWKKNNDTSRICDIKCIENL
jgi:hypothetical protein